MQKLLFESSWDKTISAKDRERILEVFRETSLTDQKHVQLTPLWKAAVNHRGELLVAVLVENFTEHPLSFDNKVLRYVDHNEIVAEHTFTLPSLVIESETSMPWTFIFPVESLRKQDFENGCLVIID